MTNQIKEPTLRDLYPDLTDEQIEEVDEAFDQYVRLALKIYDRISADPVAYAEFKQLIAEEKPKREGSTKRQLKLF